MTKLNRTGGIATLALAVFIVPASVMRPIGVPVTAWFIVRFVALAVAIVFAVAQWVQLTRREHADLAEAHELRDHARSTPADASTISTEAPTHQD